MVKIVNTIRRLWETELADQFTEKMIFRNYNEAIDELFIMLSELETSWMSFWNLKTIEDNNSELYVYLFKNIRNKENSGTDYKRILESIKEKWKKMSHSF